MGLSERIEKLNYVFCLLQNTSSMTHKKRIIDDCISDELRDDFQFCLEVLSGRHKLGYTYYMTKNDGDYRNENNTIRDIYQFLQEPLNEGDLSNVNIHSYVRQTSKYAWFLEPLVNRKLRLGIGSSVLPKSGITPMLANKYTVNRAFKDFYVTEKLDGNRCISYYDGYRWHFVSRNGKEMNVTFNMSGLPTDRVYDGEVLSPEQVQLSNNIYQSVRGDTFPKEAQESFFNKTSGLINSKAENKDLIYNIFDVVEDSVPYRERREFLDSLVTEKNVRILPTLFYGNANEAFLKDLLKTVVFMGGEGLMLNNGQATYQHKRTNDLLKYKPTYTMDMRVIDICEGTGKYEGCVGALFCQCIKDSKIYECFVGSGLNDYQRVQWANSPGRIMGKIVEVAYFSVSQASSRLGSQTFSLRFPRLKRVRDDKEDTSTF